MLLVYDSQQSGPKDLHRASVPAASDGEDCLVNVQLNCQSEYMCPCFRIFLWICVVSIYYNLKAIAKSHVCTENSIICKILAT